MAMASPKINIHPSGMLTVRSGTPVYSLPAFRLSPSSTFESKGSIPIIPWGVKSVLDTSILIPRGLMATPTMVICSEIGLVARDREIGRAHVELQSRQYLVCRLLLEKKK